MKGTDDGKTSQPLIKKLKKELTVRRGRGDQIVVQKRRQPRGHRGTPNQASWVDDFVKAVQIGKDLDGCTSLQARAFAGSPPAGYTFWRDYIGTAFAGKLGTNWGNTDLNPQTPKLFNTPYDGVFRVTTPTASVYRDSAEALTNSVNKTLTPNQRDWDNNVFWNSTSNPSRLTVRASGLYWIRANVRFNAVSGTQRILRLAVNGTFLRTVTRLSQPSAVLLDMECFAIWPFTAGDYVEVSVNANSNGCTAQLFGFQILAITPEAIV